MNDTRASVAFIGLGLMGAHMGTSSPPVIRCMCSIAPAARPRAFWRAARPGTTIQARRRPAAAVVITMICLPRDVEVTSQADRQRRKRFPKPSVGSLSLPPDCDTP